MPTTPSSGRIDSPCVRNCCLNESDICLGCFRSLSEIVSWNGLDAKEKQAVLDLAEARRRAASRS